MKPLGCHESPYIPWSFWPIAVVTATAADDDDDDNDAI